MSVCVRVNECEYMCEHVFLYVFLECTLVAYVCLYVKS